MTRQEANRLAKALKKRFGGTVEFESTNGEGRYRFSVTSKFFDGKAHLWRQDEAWKIADEVLSPEATLGITLILTYSRADLAAVK